MRSELAARLEQVRRGEVPQGYRRTKAGIIPEDWEISRFGEVFQFIPNNTYSRAFMTDSGGEIRNAHYGDVLIKYHSIIDCAAKDLPFLTPDAKINPAMFLKSGDIIIADTAEDFTAGKTVEIINVENEKVVSGLHTMACRALQHVFAPKWLGYYMDSAAYHNQLIPLIRGAKVSSIPKGEIVNTVIAFPTPEEQRKIADVLSAQDNVIALKERLIAEKTRQKRYLMQQYLSGKRRLPGFNGEWKAVAVGEMGTFYGGLSGKTKDDFGIGDATYIPFKNVLENVVIDVNQLLRVRLDKGETQNAVQQYDLFFNLSSETIGEVGMCAVLMEHLSGAYLNSFCIGFRLRRNIVSPLWLAYYFNSNLGRKVIVPFAQGVTRINLNRAAFETAVISIPPLAEQRAMAEILAAADQEIELLRRSLELERCRKKALAQLLLTGLVRLS